MKTQKWFIYMVYDCPNLMRIDELSSRTLIFDNKCRYDIILGSDFLTKSGIDIKSSTWTIYWFENVRPMREPWQLDNKEYLAMADAINIQHKEELVNEDWIESYGTSTILDAKYEKVNVNDISSQQKHLTIDQQLKLESVLTK